MQDKPNCLREGKTPAEAVPPPDHLSEAMCLADSNRNRSSTLGMALARPFGRVILAICQDGRNGCTNLRCSLRPLCMCAKQDLDEATKKEARVWLTVTACGALVILIAFFRALLF